jgi:hypothetical protein
VSTTEIEVVLSNFTSREAEEEKRFGHDMEFITIYAFYVPVEYIFDRFHFGQGLKTCERHIQGNF